MIEKKVISAVRALAEHNSFSVAADVVGTSPASFSRYINQAETYAGISLFERGGNGTFPTPAERRFLQMLDALHLAGSQFEAGVDKLRQAGPANLNIGCGPLASRTILAPLLSEILQEHSKFRALVQVRATKDPLDDLRLGKLDVVVCDLTHTPDLRDLEICLLQKEPIAFWARPSHPLHKKGSLSVKEIFRGSLGSAHLHRHWRTAVANILGNDKAAWDIVDQLPQVESDDFAFLTELACHSDLILAGMKADLAQHRSLGLLKQLHTKETLTWNICAARRAGSSFPMLDIFWKRLDARHGISPAPPVPQQAAEAV